MNTDRGRLKYPGGGGHFHYHFVDHIYHMDSLKTVPFNDESEACNGFRTLAKCQTVVSHLLTFTAVRWDLTLVGSSQQHPVVSRIL